MKIIFFGNGHRGKSCLRSMLENGWSIDLVVSDPRGEGQWYGSMADNAKSAGIEVQSPENPNDVKFIEQLRSRQPDVFILAGYGKIFKKVLIEVPSVCVLNLHGGRLPQYRGSSPMNWSLINGEKSFGLSIIRLDEGVDTGDVVIERSFPIYPDSTICDLHDIANREFPQMLLEALKQLKSGECVFRKQDEKQAAYFPLRFPDDGLIIWEMHTAEQVHNRIRALTQPYPCAFTFYQGRRVKLISSVLPEEQYYGEPGRIYRRSKKGVLVCAADRSLWITGAKDEKTEESILPELQMYESFRTLRDLLR